MSDQLTVSDQLARLTGLDFREDLAARLAGARDDQTAARRGLVRLAIRCAWSKQRDFGGDCKAWLAAWTEALGVKDRQLYRWDAAGRTLIEHGKAHWQAIHTWPLECLETVSGLTTQQIAYLVAAVIDDPEVLDRARLAHLVATLQGRELRRRGHQPAVQPVLPGLEELLDFDAGTLDPVDEARRAAAHFERFARSYEAHPDAVPDDELERAHAVAAAAAAATAAELERRGVRVA